MTLRLEPSGTMLVGTGSPGRVFRVDTAGKGFLALDTPYQEVRAIRLDAKGLIYAAALNGQPSERRQRHHRCAGRAHSPAHAQRVHRDAVVRDHRRAGHAADQRVERPREARATTAGAVYRIQPDGLSDVLWESKDDSPYDLALEADGAVLVATGDKGKIFRLSGEPVAAGAGLARAGAARHACWRASASARCSPPPIPGCWCRCRTRAPRVAPTSRT